MVPAEIPCLPLSALRSGVSCTATSVPRPLTGLLASTSTAGAAAEAALLRELPAGLRGVLWASPLPVSVAQQAQLRARQVTEVVKQMEAAAARIAALQRRQLQLRWDQVEAALASRLAPQFCYAISLSNAGQVTSNCNECALWSEAQYVCVVHSGLPVQLHAC